MLEKSKCIKKLKYFTIKKGRGLFGRGHPNEYI
jgi:hypothetical protein